MFVLHFNRQNDLADHKLAHPGGQIYRNNTRASWPCDEIRFETTFFVRSPSCTAVASMRRTEALASVQFYQILSIFIFFIRLIILEDFIRLISYNGPCVRLGCSFSLATALSWAPVFVYFTFMTQCTKSHCLLLIRNAEKRLIRYYFLAAYLKFPYFKNGTFSADT